MRNSEILLDVIGELDEMMIPDLTEEPHQHRPLLRRIMPVAAAVAVFALIVTAAVRFGSPRQIPTLPPAQETTATAPTEEAATEQPTQTEPAIVPTSAAPTEATAQPEEPTAAPSETTAETQAPTQLATEAPAVQTEPPATEPAQTEPVTEAPEPITEAALEVTEAQGFRIETFRDRRCIKATSAFPAPTGTLRRCVLDSGMVELCDVHENGAVNEYRIRPVGGETEFIVTQQEYDSFSLTVDLDAEISVALDGRDSFFILQDDNCTIYWFEDGEGFSVSGAGKDLQYLLEIFRNLRPADEN